MHRIIKFIKTKWTDPVWSKVFAAGIIGLFTSIGLLIWSLIKKIPFDQLWVQLMTFLTENHIQINYLTIAIIAISLLIILIPMFLLKVVSFQLKHLKLPQSLKSNQFNFEEFINGSWTCEYIRQSDNWQGKETATIEQGNKYLINRRLVFVLTDIVVNNNKKQITWVKTAYPNNSIHSKEVLTIINDRELSGTDNVGYHIKYLKK